MSDKEWTVFQPEVWEWLDANYINVVPANNNNNGNYFETVM